MASLLERLREKVSPSARADRHNVDALSARLGVPVEEAAVIYRRSREVGFGAAMTEHEERSGQHGDHQPPGA